MKVCKGRKVWRSHSALRVAHYVMEEAGRSSLGGRRWHKERAVGLSRPKQNGCPAQEVQEVRDSDTGWGVPAWRREMWCVCVCRT